MNTKNPLKLTFLLSKRLYKKISFLMILLALVLVSFLGKTALDQENSMLKIAVVAKNNAVAERLISSNGAVEYKYYSINEANDLLSSGKIDAIFQFNENFEESIKGFATGDLDERPLKITVREKTVFINLALERVYAETFPIIADEYYYNYGREEMGFNNKDALRAEYGKIERDSDIVEFSYYNSADSVEQTNYLLTPMRGILAAILAFCALSSALYFLTDCENGNMDAVPINKRWFWQVLYTATGAVNIAIFIIISLFATGLIDNIGIELIVMMLYIIASVGFANVISGICGKSKMLAAAMPIVTIAILALCPIFLNNKIPFVPKLLPTYWYLASIYNVSKIPMLIIYCAIVNALSFVIWKTRKYTK